MEWEAESCELLKLKFGVGDSFPSSPALALAPGRMFGFEGGVVARGLDPRLGRLWCFSSVGEGAALMLMADGAQLDVFKPIMRLFRGGAGSAEISALESPLSGRSG